MRNETIASRGNQSSGLRDESPRLTLADMLGVVVGFAICVAMPFTFRFGPIGLVGAQKFPLWFIAVLGILWIMQGLAFAISTVVISRTAQFRRQPRSAEWLALMVSVWFLRVNLPLPDDFIASDFTVWRWFIGGLALVVSVVSLLFAVSKAHSGVIRTLLVCLAALIWMWGPCAVLQLEFADLFPGLDRLGDGWTFWFVLSALKFVAVLPLAMLFGIPGVATILARRRDRFQSLVWTEWLGILCATLIGTTLLMLALLDDNHWQTTSWIAERTVGVLGLAIVVVLSRFVLSHYSRYLNQALWLDERAQEETDEETDEEAGGSDTGD
jgi:hypothetical protein